MLPTRGRVCGLYAREKICYCYNRFCLVNGTRTVGVAYNDGIQICNKCQETKDPETVDVTNCNCNMFEHLERDEAAKEFCTELKFSWKSAQDA